MNQCTDGDGSVGYESDGDHRRRGVEEREEEVERKKESKE
jgi:hypothetical protein